MATPGPIDSAVSPSALIPGQRSARWHFARLGALGALLAALLLEGLFALSGAGEYFFSNTTNVVMFRHAPESRSATRETLGTGDIQLTLDWKGTTDLDLHCDDPTGKRIYFGAKQSSSGGRLDLDMNAGNPPWSSDSIENIFWPFGSAPEGQYIVYVHAYRRHGGPERTPFHLRALHKGKVDSIRGVSTFQRPAGTTLSDPVSAGQPQEVFRFRIEATPPAGDGVHATEWVAMLVSGLWVALVSVGLTGAILIGLSRWYREHRPWAVSPGERAGRLLAFTALWGMAHGVLVQAAFAVLGAVAVDALEGWRLLAWLALSWLVGAHAGRLIPAHLPPREGARGGIWGGASAALAFVYLVESIPPTVLAQADVPARLLAAMCIGACIGWQVRLPAPLLVPAEAAPIEAPAFIAAPQPEPIPEPIPVPTIELHVTRSRGGREAGGHGAGGRALGRPRRHSGGRKARAGEDRRE